jgi:acyl-coenzyme A thioesterase PaaI-like protein
MNEDFEQISHKPGFMKHNGGLLFKSISENKYEFKTTIKENHLNAAGITHGGFIAAFVDAGAGTAAHRSADQNPCVTISLDLKFISAVKLNQELVGKTKIQKRTKSMFFLTCELTVNDKIVATASGVWKILNKKIPGRGPGG